MTDPHPPRVLAVIPARGGSKGLPGKNIRRLFGLPLIVHSIRAAELTPTITRCVVSTDSEEIAAVARSFGGEAPFLRPSELAGSDTLMTPSRSGCRARRRVASASCSGTRAGLVGSSSSTAS